jgi:hypothetical protein
MNKNIKDNLIFSLEAQFNLELVNQHPYITLKK